MAFSPASSRHGGSLCAADSSALSDNRLQAFTVLRNPFSAPKSLRIPAREACLLGAKVRKTGPSSLATFFGPAARRGPGSEPDSQQVLRVKPAELSWSLTRQPAKVPEWNRTSQTSLRRPSHHRLLLPSQNGALWPKNALTTMSPLRHRSLWAEKCAKAPQFLRGHGSWQV